MMSPAHEYTKAWGPECRSGPYPDTDCVILTQSLPFSGPLSSSPSNGRVHIFQPVLGCRASPTLSWAVVFAPSMLCGLRHCP